MNSPRLSSILLIVIAIFSLTSQDAQASDLPESIVFSEIAWAGSSISSADEWIELYNISAKPIDLTGWQIINGITKEPLVVLEYGTIPAQGYFLIANNGPNHQFSGGQSALNIEPDLVDSSLSLSNSGFYLELVDSTGKIQDISGALNQDGKAFPPLMGNSKTPASMTRILDPLGVGTQPESWISANTSLNFDPGLPDLGDPQNSGLDQLPQNSANDQESENTQESSSNQIAQVQLSTVLSNYEAWQGKVINTSVLVAVPLNLYSNEYLIIRDSSNSVWHAELKIPSGIKPDWPVGTHLKLIARVSTAFTPRLLLSSLSDVQKIGKVELAPITLTSAQVRLLQFTKIRGRLIQEPHNWFIDTGDQIIKLSRRRGVTWQEFEDGAQVQIAGVITDISPIVLKVLDQASIKIIAKTQSISSDEEDLMTVNTEQAESTLPPNKTSEHRVPKQLKDGAVKAASVQADDFKATTFAQDATDDIDPTVLGQKTSRNHSNQRAIAGWVSGIGLIYIAAYLGRHWLKQRISYFNNIIKLWKI